MIGLSTYVMCSIAILCFMPAWPAQTHARPLARPQRQTLTGELATGLTGTGTSFNPLYEGQNVMDSYYGYQTQQQKTSPNEDISPPILGGNNWSQGGGAYQGYRGTYGTKGVGSIGNSVNGGFGYGSSTRPSYSKVNFNGGGNAYGGKGWQGFGGGVKNPSYGGGRPTSQYGVKY